MAKTQTKTKAKTLLVTSFVRKKGFLYFCGTSDDGYLTVCETAMNRKGRNGDKKK